LIEQADDLSFKPGTSESLARRGLHQSGLVNKDADAKKKFPAYGTDEFWKTFNARFVQRGVKCSSNGID
jgi:hypothetical protein